MGKQDRDIEHLQAQLKYLQERYDAVKAEHARFVELVKGHEDVNVMLYKINALIPFTGDVYRAGIERYLPDLETAYQGALDYIAGLGIDLTPDTTPPSLK